MTGSSHGEEVSPLGRSWDVRSWSFRVKRRIAKMDGCFWGQVVSRVMPFTLWWFNIAIGKTHYKWPCSIAMFVYQRVSISSNLDIKIKNCVQWDLWRFIRVAHVSHKSPSKGSSFSQIDFLHSHTHTRCIPRVYLFSNDKLECYMVLCMKTAMLCLIAGTKC